MRRPPIVAIAYLQAYIGPPGFLHDSAIPSPTLHSPNLDRVLISIVAHIDSAMIPTFENLYKLA